MNANKARLIRIGIMSQCLPYRVDMSPYAPEVKWEVFDHAAYRKYQYDWIMHSHIPLVSKARNRTNQWKVIRHYD